MSDQPALFEPVEIPLWADDETRPALLPCVRWRYQPHSIEVREQIRAAALAHLKGPPSEWKFSMHDALQQLDRLNIDEGLGSVELVPASEIAAGAVVLVGSHPFRPLGHDSRWRPERVLWQHDQVVLTVKGALLDCRGGSAMVAVDRLGRL